MVLLIVLVAVLHLEMPAFLGGIATNRASPRPIKSNSRLEMPAFLGGIATYVWHM